VYSIVMDAVNWFSGCYPNISVENFWQPPVNPGRPENGC